MVQLSKTAPIWCSFIKTSKLKIMVARVLATLAWKESRFNEVALAKVNYLLFTLQIPGPLAAIKRKVKQYSAANSPPSKQLPSFRWLQKRQTENTNNH